MHKPSNNISQSQSYLHGARFHPWKFHGVFSTLMLVVLLTTMMTIECNGYSVVPQQQRHVRSQQQNQQQWRDHRRDKYRSTIIAKGSDSDNDIATSALRANSIITLDGQEIRQEITAMNNIIFVKVKEALSTTLGGIVIPDQSKQRPTEGTVVACGPGKIHPHSGKRISNPISVGMNVVYGQYDGKAVVYNDEECQIIRDDNVLLAYPGGNTVMTIDNVMPIRDYVLVELISPSKNSDVPDNAIATNSGIVIAASVLKDNLPCEGRVVKIGEGRMLPDGISFSASPVQVHDLIKFKEYAGNDILMNDGKQYSVVKMVDILCTYRNE